MLLATLAPRNVSAGRVDNHAPGLFAYAAMELSTSAVVEAVLAAGADLESRSGIQGIHHTYHLSDQTPPHEAAAIGKNSAVVEALLASGSDPGAKNGKGQTPCDLCRRNESFGSEKVVQCQRRAFADRHCITVAVFGHGRGDGRRRARSTPAPVPTFG